MKIRELIESLSIEYSNLNEAKSAEENLKQEQEQRKTYVAEKQQGHRRKQSNRIWRGIADRKDSNVIEIE
jgi:hypothetical protein